MALMLTGSPRIAATRTIYVDDQVPPELLALKDEAKALFEAGHHDHACGKFAAAANRALQLGVTWQAARNWNSAGACSIITAQFRVALEEFATARKLATQAKDMKALAAILNNLANLYIQTGQFELALAVAKEGLSGEGAKIDSELR